MQGSSPQGQETAGADSGDFKIILKRRERFSSASTFSSSRNEHLNKISLE